MPAAESVRQLAGALIRLRWMGLITRKQHNALCDVHETQLWHALEHCQDTA